MRPARGPPGAELQISETVAVDLFGVQAPDELLRAILLA